MASGDSGDSNIDPRIDLKSFWPEDDVRFMERMLRATGKFHIVPIYQPVEEHVEEGEDNHFDFGGPRGRITATSTPVRTVPRSFSAEPPSYKLVRPPTPRPNSVRFRDQDTSSQNENTLSQNQDHVSQETHDRAPLTHVNYGQYNVPTPNVRVPLSTVHEELGSHTISETLQTNTTFGKSQYEQRPPPSSQHEQRPLPSSQYEQRPPPRSQYEQMPPLSSQHEQMPPLSARHRQIPSLPPLQPQIKQEASYMPPSVPPVYNKTDNGTPPPQTSCKTDQAFQTDIRVKQLGYPHSNQCHLNLTISMTLESSKFILSPHPHKGVINLRWKGMSFLPKHSSVGMNRIRVNKQLNRNNCMVMPQYIIPITMVHSK